MRFSAAYREQANARTDTVPAYGRTVAQASDNHDLSCKFKSTDQARPRNYDQCRKLPSVTVRLRHPQPGSAPGSPGTTIGDCRGVTEGVCHETSPPLPRSGPMSGAGDDDEDLEPAPFILMRAEDTFDGQERVFSRPAYDLQVRATSHSATCGHPGYGPDDYLEHLSYIARSIHLNMPSWSRIRIRIRLLPLICCKN